MSDICADDCKCTRKRAINGIKAALEAKDEPVAWIYKGEKSFDGNKWSNEYELTASKQVALWKDKDAKPLYTTLPPVAEPHKRKPLTDEEINALDYSGTRIEFVRAIEAKLKEQE